jgi:hypothetical protein
MKIGVKRSRTSQSGISRRHKMKKNYLFDPGTMPNYTPVDNPIKDEGLKKKLSREMVQKKKIINQESFLKKVK